MALEEAAGTVTAATSAQEALDAPGPFNLILSDIGLPDMDGYAFIRKVRSQHPHRSVPAIALTAYARGEDAERALEAGFQCISPNPLTSPSW